MLILLEPKWLKQNQHIEATPRRSSGYLTLTMQSAALLVLLVSTPLASARLLDNSKACATDDLKHRAQLQNKLAGVCVDMCKEVGAFPKCTCPDFVAPDSTPGVMTWPELLEHMDNLSEWGHGQ